MLADIHKLKVNKDKPSIKQRQEDKQLSHSDQIFQREAKIWQKLIWYEKTNISFFIIFCATLY